MQYAYMRVIQTGDNLCFALKPLFAREIGGNFWRKNLDGDCALQTSVTRTVHLPHAASAQRRLDLIGSEFCPGREAHAWAVINVGVIITLGTAS
jgi:hypothetical protein